MPTESAAQANKNSQTINEYPYNVDSNGPEPGYSCPGADTNWDI